MRPVRLAAKLRATRKLLKKRFVDLESERPYIMVTADEIDALLGETQTTSSDYSAVKALVDGEISTFMGFTFVPVEGWPATYTEAGTGFTIRQLPVWVKSGMHFGSWQDLTITINSRPDKNNIKQIHGCMSMGATRLEEGKVLDLEVKVT